LIQFKKHKKAWIKLLEYSARKRPYAALNINDYISSFSIQSMIGWYILFFEENEITISVKPFLTTNFKYQYNYKIDSIDEAIIGSIDFKTRPECWMDMINQAFELLEKTL
jgi:hypothetical protein